MNKKSKGYIFSIILTIIAGALITYEVKVKTGNMEESKEVVSFEEEISQEKNNDGAEKNSTKKTIDLPKEEEEMIKEDPIGEKVLNGINDVEKEAMHFKLFNAIDNFSTCMGEFIEERPKENFLAKYTFAIDSKNKNSVTVDNTQGRKSITLIFNDGKRKVYDDNNNTYRESEEKQYNEKSTLVRPIRLFLKPERQRKDLGYLGVSRYIISSDSIPQVLFIYEDWDFVESSFLGRDVYKIEGIINPELSKQLQGKFSLMMDKETGIILQFLSFDESGNIKYKLECTTLEVNTIIDNSLYNKDTSGYEKK